MLPLIKQVGKIVAPLVCGGAKNAIFDFPTELQTLKEIINRIDRNATLIDHHDPLNADFLNELETDRKLLEECEKLRWYRLVRRFRNYEKLETANKFLDNLWSDTINRQSARRMLLLSEQVEQTGKQIMLNRFIDGKDYEPLYSSPVWERRGRSKELLDPMVNWPDPSGKSKRKDEFTLPSLEARATMIKDKSRNMDVAEDVNFEELAKLMEGFGMGQVLDACEKAKNQAQLRNATQVMNEDYQKGISLVNDMINEP